MELGLTAHLTALKSDTRFLGLEEERALIELWQKKQDQGSLEALLRAYQPFISRLARQYSFSADRRSDLTNEGIIALIDALDSYTPEESTRFLSYARSFVRSAMVTARNKIDHVIDVPRQKLHAANSGRLCEGDAELLKALSKKVSIQDTSDDIAQSRNDCGFYAVERAQTISFWRDSLDSAMHVLSEDERRIVSMRLDREETTVGAMAEKLGMKKERVKALEERAFMRLRVALVSQGFSPKFLVAS